MLLVGVSHRYRPLVVFYQVVFGNRDKEREREKTNYVIVLWWTKVAKVVTLFLLENETEVLYKT